MANPAYTKVHVLALVLALMLGLTGAQVIPAGCSCYPHDHAALHVTSGDGIYSYLGNGRGYHNDCVTPYCAGPGVVVDPFYGVADGGHIAASGVYYPCRNNVFNNAELSCREFCCIPVVPSD